jgi:hypothetical protein
MRNNATIVRSSSSFGDGTSIVQNGMDNQATHTGSGGRSPSSIIQNGDANTASVTKSLNYNGSTIMQTGNLNAATVVQSGVTLPGLQPANVANIIQAGDGFVASIAQAGSGNVGTIYQH